MQARHRSTAPPKSTESQRARQNLPFSSPSSTSANTHTCLSTYSRANATSPRPHINKHKIHHQPNMSDFDKAVADSKKLVSKPSNDELLQLYGMFAPRPRPRPSLPGTTRVTDVLLLRPNSPLQGRQRRGLRVGSPAWHVRPQGTFCPRRLSPSLPCPSLRPLALPAPFPPQTPCRGRRRHMHECVHI